MGTDMRPAYAIVLSALVMAVGVASPAAATTGTPADFQGAYDAETRSIVLSWDEVAGVAPNPTVYTIYANGEVLGTTTSLTYSDPFRTSFPETREYQVTASVGGSEGLPSSSIIAISGMAPPLDPNCDMWVIIIDTSPPDADVVPHWECIPP